MTHQNARIIKGPHLLFTGANGHKTYGILVQNLDPPEKIERDGKCHTYTINDFSILNPCYEQWLGLTGDEYNQVVEELKRLSESQT